MKRKDGKVVTAEARKVQRFFKQKGFPSAECYQRRNFDPLLRLRIVDDRFHGLSRVEREDIVEPMIQELPDELQSAITMLVLVTPEERATSLLSLEFDDPSRVML